MFTLTVAYVLQLALPATSNHENGYGGGVHGPRPPRPLLRPRLHQIMRTGTGGGTWSPTWNSTMSPSPTPYSYPFPSPTWNSTMSPTPYPTPNAGCNGSNSICKRPYTCDALYTLFTNEGCCNKMQTNNTVNNTYYMPIYNGIPINNCTSVHRAFHSDPTCVTRCSVNNINNY